MIDTAQWDLHGSVRSVRSELAEWNAEQHTWNDVRFSRFVAFDGDGRITQLDQPGANGSIYRTQYFYDALGRLREESSGTVGEPVVFTRRWDYDDRGREASISTVHADGRVQLWRQSTYDDLGRRTDCITSPPQVKFDAVEGSKVSYGAPAAAIQITRHDASGRPIDIEFRDATGSIVRRVRMTRDADGRVLTEETEMPAMAFPREPGMSDADFEVVKAMVATSFGSIRTVNEYDAGGRLTTRARQFGQLGEERTVYRYDTAGRPLEESMVRVDRMMSLEKDGSPRLHSDTTRRHETRFTYVDDRHGNWTERTVSWRIEEGAAFVVSNVERRTIEYYDEAS